MTQALPAGVRSLVLASLTGALLWSTSGAANTDIILRAADAPLVRGAWQVVADSTAAGGSRLSNRDAGVPKSNALAAPVDYFEMTFAAPANTPHRLWVRGRAQNNSYNNDSVYVQFSDSVTTSGAPTWRIGTTSATSVILEDCTGCGVAGWGWADNGYGLNVLGPTVQFERSGMHTIRIQVREDGLSIDQIVLSPSTYLTQSPGATKHDTTRLTSGGGSGSTPPASIATVRGPYLQQVFDRSAVLVWATREPGPASARVGTSSFPAVTSFFSAASTGLSYDYYQHESTVSGLSPSTTYPYELIVGSATLTQGTQLLTTAPATGTGTVRFIAFGDSGTGSTAQRSLAALMDPATFDLSLHTGDVVYGSTSGTGDASYATFQSWFFDIYGSWLPRRPFMPSMGNHDSRSSNSWGRAYLSLFVLPDHAAAGAFPDHAERYYSFDFGPVHFVALDTERAFQDTNRRAAQLAWLEADLAATAQPWKIAYYHRSPFTAGTHHGSDLPVRQAFTPIFERHGVQVSLSAHEHLYERSVPWRHGTGSQAVTYVVTGGGGAPVYTAGQGAWTAAAVARHHFTRMTVGDCTARIEAVGVDGTVFDAHTLNRCDQARDAGPPSVSFVSPATGASVSGLVTVEAYATDDVQVEKVDLWVNGQLHAVRTAPPYRFTWDAGSTAGSRTLELRAHDIAGNRATSQATVIVTSSGAGGARDVVLHAAHVPAASVSGDWAFVADSTAAGGLRLHNPNRGQRLAVSATPVSYFEVTFDAVAGVPYHLWFRMRADSNSYNNDSVSVQFDRAVSAGGAPVYRIGTTSGASVILEEGTNAGVRNWGWNDNGYGGLGAHIYFAESGTQRMRVQVREDGVSIDQMVLSPATYLTEAPGRLKDDSTILAP